MIVRWYPGGSEMIPLAVYWNEGERYETDCALDIRSAFILPFYKLQKGLFLR